MDKPFLTYDEQIDYLQHSKNIEVDDVNELKRVGYFNLINGYKNPFVAGIDNGQHYYFKNTKISYLISVKEFDDELRILLFKYICKIEEEIKALVGYQFEEFRKSNPNKSWNDKNNFNPNKINDKNFIIFLDNINHSIKTSKLEYIKHYQDDTNLMPAWVFLKILTFSNLIDFIEFSNSIVKDAICHRYQMIDNRERYDYKLLKGSLHWARVIRNISAHNERVYTVKQSGKIIETYHKTLLPDSYKKDNCKKLIDLIIYMKYYLSKQDYYNLINKFGELLTNLSDTIPSKSFDYVRAQTGLKNLAHLEILTTSGTKEIFY
ncbi:MAG: hypothetical protein ATN36_01125 [Epulopiscium sp. Nele67-Bin005]|nr:MAG: hypothetical protein ATN36_01125 [Epulopiscium sp. Nele67-Bin005]